MDTSGGFLQTAAGLRLAVLVALTLVSPLHQARAQSGVSNAAPVLHDLAGLGELRSQFEIDVDKVRIVLLLSPTWPACINAARWAQKELLSQRRRTDLRVYAVWFNMYPGDARRKWPPTLLTDDRVAHYWDEQRALGTAYLSNLPAMLDRRAEATLQPTADAMWDAFYLYAPGDRWQEPLPLPVRWGYPIMPTREQLARELDAIAVK